MDDKVALWNEFRTVWTLGRIKAMTLQEYTQAHGKDTFTYWLESRLDKLGSIWGGSALKFGIYSRDNLDHKENKSGRMYSDTYGWMDKYGKTPELAFSNIKKQILDVIDAVQHKDLTKIDKVDLGAAYKWKIAFHFQPSLSEPICVNIFKPEALAKVSGMSRGTSISAMQKAILANRKGVDVMEYATILWKAYEGATIDDPVAVGNGEKNTINTIFFGPPGTGKTFHVLQLMKEAEARAMKERPKVAAATRELDDSRSFWHIAPGVNGYLWDQLKTSSTLGYEWCGKELGDLSMLPTSADHYEIRHRFSKVRAGDYFVVISGKRVLGLARASQSYDYSTAKDNHFDFQTIQIEWVTQFTPPILLDSTSTQSFSRMNAGSRWKMLIEQLSDRGFMLKTSASQIERRKTATTAYRWVTFHQSYSYEDFLQGIKPVLGEEDEESTSKLDYEIHDGTFYQACDNAAQKAGYTDLADAVAASFEDRRDRFHSADPYYIVIDEISRGNVANVFGELITLIESDKRLGEENEIIVELPYSKSRFGVPPNLRIIGTMNTADRSVEALDIALRRRFSFVELYPDPSSIPQPDGLDVDLAKMLTTINNRIEVLLDKDHCLGHSYFMNLEAGEDPFEELRQVFRNKILPLLQEYFYSDPSKIGMVLGGDFVKEKHLFGQVKFFTQFENELESVERKSYSFEIPSDHAAFRKIYEL